MQLEHYAIINSFERDDERTTELHSLVYLRDWNANDTVVMFTHQHINSLSPIYSDASYKRCTSVQILEALSVSPSCMRQIVDTKRSGNNTK